MSTGDEDQKKDFSGEWAPTGPELGDDGKMVGRGPLEESKVPQMLPAVEEKLELQERVAPQVVDYEPVYRDDRTSHQREKRRRRIFWVVPILFVLGLITLGVFSLRPTLQRELPEGPKATNASMLIMSEPSGAQVRIGGTLVGTTPYAADNLYEGTVPLEVTLPGYAPFTTTLVGHAETHLTATLEKARRKK